MRSLPVLDAALASQLADQLVGLEDGVVLVVFDIEELPQALADIVEGGPGHEDGSGHGRVLN
jgi:hypothetical protein